MTVTGNDDPSSIRSDNHFIIDTRGCSIRNNQDGYSSGNTFLDKEDWSGILVGTDGYPTKDNNDYYYIAGGDENERFKATAIEFYGVDSQI